MDKLEKAEKYLKEQGRDKNEYLQSITYVIGKGFEKIKLSQFLTDFAEMIVQQPQSTQSEVNVGDVLIYSIAQPASGQRKPCLTVNRKYIAEKTRINYRMKKVAIAIRDDHDKLRWYSFNQRYWQLESKLKDND